MAKQGKYSRRELCRLGATAVASGGLMGRSVLARPAANQHDKSSITNSRRPRNIIFMISDGMSAGVPSMAKPFSYLVRGKGTNWSQLASKKQTVQGLTETHSLDSLVTDSAAASSCWATGCRVPNGSINVLPDGTKLTPIMRLAHDAGLGTGLVTTTQITHATPAGFASVQRHRGDQHLIAQQYKGLVDVLLGGGREYFDPARRKDGLDLAGAFQADGYVVCSNRQELNAANGGRMLGLFCEGHVPYTIDVAQDQKQAESLPTLAEMTTKALEVLSGKENGFLLQVEGGRIDHAAHNNDGAAMLWEQLAFDDAVGVALDFAERRGNTLVVVTTDHGNSNPGLNGMGSRYSGSTSCFARLRQSKGSFEMIMHRLRQAGGKNKPASTMDAVAIVEQITGIKLDEKDAEAVASSTVGQRPPELHHQQDCFDGVLGQILGNHNGLGWTGTTHTADLVFLMAAGVGSELLGGLQPNTAVFGHLTKLLGIDYRNPRVEQSRAGQTMIPLAGERRFQSI